MTNVELEALFFKTGDTIIPPEYFFEKYDVEKGEYTGFILLKTGEQVWLENKDKPSIPPVDETRICLGQMQAGMAELALQTARNSLFKN